MRRKKSVKIISVLCAVALLVPILFSIGPLSASAAQPRLEDNPSVFGWEDDLNGVIAYRDGSYDLRAEKDVRISFGIYNNPSTLKWYLEDEYLPMLTTEFERDNCTVKIQNFGNKVAVKGNDYVVAYSRVSIHNHGTSSVVMDPGASSELIRLSGADLVVRAGETVNHDFMIVSDRFGNKNAPWPDEASLRAAAPDFDTAHTEMVTYWNNRLKEVSRFTEMPEEGMAKILDATFIQFCIINDDGLYAVGENGYDGGGSWKGDQMEMTVYNLEHGNLHAIKENMIDSQWYQWNEEAVWWKAGWQWASYLAKTGDIDFIRDRYINVNGNVKDDLTDFENEGSRYGKEITLPLSLKFIQSCRDPETGTMKESNIDTMGYWIMGEWNSLIGLAGNKYICDYLYENDTKADAALKAQYQAWSKECQEMYDDLYLSGLKMLKSTMDEYDLTYIPSAIDQSNEQNRMQTPWDGNWANHFFCGRWMWEASLFGADQEDVVDNGVTYPSPVNYVDNSFDYGLGRLVGTLPPYAAGGFPGYGCAYNAAYGSGALRGDTSRSYAIYAMKFLMENQNAPAGWWETVLYPGAINWEPGVHPIGGVGSCPHTWGNTSSRYAVATSFATQKMMANPSEDDLILGRGTPREWMLEGKVTELVNYPLNGGERVDIRMEGLKDGAGFTFKLKGAAPSGDIAVQPAALLDGNVKSVTVDGVEQDLSKVYDSQNGIVTVPGSSKEITVMLKDTFPKTSFEAEDASVYAREKLKNNGDSHDIKVETVEGLSMQSGFKKQDSVLTYHVYVEEAGSYNVTAQFVNQSGSDKRISVYANSEQADMVIYPSGDGIQTQTSTLALKKGMNDISYKNDFGDDSISISFAGISIEKTDSPALGYNIAYGKAVSSNKALSNAALITDGKLATGAVSVAGSQYIQVDFGKEYLVNAIAATLQNYDGVTAQLSTTSTFEGAKSIQLTGNSTVFDAQVRARYIRVTTAQPNAWTELMVFGNSAPPQAEEEESSRAIIMMEAENADDLTKVTVKDCPEGGKMVTDIGLNDYIKFDRVNFGNGDDLFEARVASSANAGGTIELRIDSIDGPLVGSLSVPDTGALDKYQTVKTSVKGASGNHDLYLKFTGGGSSESMFDLNWVKLYSGGIRSVMVFGPHPDDEVLGSGGIIRRAVEDNVPIKVIIATTGDGGYFNQQQGYNRIEESYQASTLLGVKPQDIIFLGYGDGSLTSIMSATDPNQIMNPTGLNDSTYGSPEHPSYAMLTKGKENKMTKNNLMGDLSELISTHQPTEVYLPSQYDNHGDHQNLYKAVERTLGNTKEELTDYGPTMYRTLVQLPFAMDTWPEREDPEDLNAPMRPHAKPQNWEQNIPEAWDSRVSVTVPDAMQVVPRDQNLKYQALMKYNTAIAQDKTLWLSYVKTDELFLPQTTFSSDISDMINVAKDRPVTSSASVSGLNRVTDGNLQEYADLGHGTQWVQIDLGMGYDLSAAKLWHFYEDRRTYHGVVVQLSNDPAFKTGVQTVFNNDSKNLCGLGNGTDDEYIETPDGKLITFENVNARYLRAYTSGSTANSANHVVEIQALTKDATSSAPASVIASNGELKVTFNIDPGAVSAGDFAAILSIDGGEAATLTLKNFSYSVDTKTATLAFDKIEAQKDELHAEIVVSYQGTALPAATFRIPGTGDGEKNLALGLMATIIGDGFMEKDRDLIRFATDGSIENRPDPKPGLDPLGYLNVESGFAWVVFDLGATYDLHTVKMWHYYPDQRIYKDLLIQVSDDPNFETGVTTVFNNDKDDSVGYGVGEDDEYAESKAGKEIRFNATGRYIRTSLNGSYKNGSSQLVEFEVYGTPAKEFLFCDFDQNGVVDAADKDSITKYFAGWVMDELTDAQKKCLDMNEDGKIDGVDKILISRYFREILK